MIATRRLLAAVPLAAGLLWSAGCSTGTAPLQQADLEAELSKQLTSADFAVDDVECPGDLAAKKGTTMTCDFTSDGKQMKVGVIVTSVKDNTVFFNATPK